MLVRHPLRTAARALRGAPIEAQLVVTRRCNLSCGYCTEYDASSAEVPFETLCRRIDALHRLQVINIAMLGGEPLLHSRIDDLVRHAGREAQVSITTNGFVLDDERIDRLNDAGLANLQISIDALRPDPSRFIQKTLRSLRPKVERLAARARFAVHATIVLCDRTADDFAELAALLRDLGVRVSVNLLHDATGAVAVEGGRFVALWDEHFGGGNAFSHIEHRYGRELLEGRRPEWTCRAGSRFLYVDEFGKVQLCSAQRGRIDKDVTAYGPEDLRAHRRTVKGCERGCAVLCVFRDSQLDNDPAALIRSLVRGIREGGVKL